MHEVVVAIHQPSYFPWPGYFHKIFASDVFVLLDHVSIARQNFTARVPVRTESGKKYLRIPLRKHHPTTRILDVVLADENWVQSHLGILRYYKNSPFFKTYYPWVEDLLLKVDLNQSLAKINTFLLLETCKLLEISTLVTLSSEMEPKSSRDELMMELTKKSGGSIYFSGTRAMNYQRPEDFEAQGIRLVYQYFFDYLQEQPYAQAQGDFMNGLTILDTLFNVGVNGIQELLETYEKKFPIRSPR